MFPYFEVLGKTIGSYGLCAFAGLFVCGVVACVLAKRYKIAYEDVILLMVAIGVSLLIGGHLLYGITNTNKLIALFKEASSYNIKQFFGYFVTYFGGMVFYGGFLGACVGLLIYTKFSKEVERGIAFDLFAVCIPLFHVFGRIGCFLSGCCYGMESSFGFVVHGNTLIPELNDVRRLPVPLFEAACNFVIFLVLLKVFLKGKKQGKVIWYYMLIYPVVRFTLEFFRGDAVRGFLFGLSTSQWISIGLFVVAVWKLFLAKNNRKKNVAYASVVLAVVLVAGATPQVVYATENAVAEESAKEENEQPLEGGTSGEVSAGQQEGEGTETATDEEWGFNSHEKFVIFVCCLFSVALCVAVGLWGNPNDRLKDKYKRARKQQMQEEKRKKEREKIAAMRAAEEAKYAEELAQYEADVKAYKEAKAAKEAAKAAKKAEKLAKKNSKE